MTDPRNKPIARTFEVASPAVAQGFTITPNTAGDWLIRSLTFQLVTDANAATRAVTLSVSDTAVSYRLLTAGATQAASLTRVYSGSEGVSGAAGAGGFIQLNFPTEGIWLPVGHTLTVAVENIQAGDQISAIRGYRFEFPKGPREHFWPMVTLLMEESS